MNSQELKAQITFMGRLAPGQDLLKALEGLCAAHDVTFGFIKGIGAVRNAVIGYFDQDAGRYIENRIDHPLEIVALNANVSMRDGEPFVHAHIALGDRDGRLYGGHLMEGTTIFVFEYVLTRGKGMLERKHDDELNLDLWEV